MSQSHNSGAAQAPTKSLLEIFAEHNASSISEEGIRIPNAFIKMADGSMTVTALALTGEDAPYEAFRAVFSIILKGEAVEAVWGLDRFTKPDQGTTLGDLLSVHHWLGGDDWRFGIMEYQHAPRIVKPICWDNPIWTPNLRKEMAGMCFRLGSEVTRARRGQ